MTPLQQLDHTDITPRSRALRRVAQRLLSNEHDLDDVVQDTWLAAVEASSRRVRNFDAWLSRVVRYQATRTLRRRALRERYQARVARATQAGIEVADRRTASGIDIERIVERLPEPYRSVVRRRYFDGRSVDAIAAELGRSRNTVKSQLRRALAMMRRELTAAEDAKPSWAARAVAFLVSPLQRHGRVAVVVLTVSVQLLLVSLLASRPVELEPDAVGSVVRSPLARGAALSDQHAERVGVPVGVSELGALSVEVHRADDGSPVPGFAVLIEHLDAPGAKGALRRRSDRGGRISIEDLTPGRYRLVPRRGERSSVDVEAGLEARVRLEVPAGVRVRGRIRTPSGLPIRGAAIRLTWPDRLDAWSDVTRSDVAGEFSFDGADARAWIAGWPPAGTPSLWRFLGSRATFEDSVYVELVANDVVEPVRGRVLAADGGPLSGARVVLAGSNSPRLSHDGSWNTSHRSLTTSTDDDGRFVLDHVSARREVLMVVAPGHVPWTGPPPRGVVPLTVRLEAARHLAGRVVRSGGAPVPGAVVEIDQEWPLPDLTLWTDARGGFGSDRVATGPVTLRAHDSAGRSAVWNTVLDGSWRAPVELELSDASTIRGRACDRHGQPLEGWLVTLAQRRDRTDSSPYMYLTGTGAPLRATTDAAGRFAFPARDPVEHAVQLRPPTRPDGPPCAWLTSVYPGGEEILLRTGTEPEPCCRIEGAVATTFLGTRVVARAPSLDYEAIALVDYRTGAFAIEDLPPATYDILVWSGDGQPLPTLRRTLRAGQTVDVGTLRVPVCGSFELRLSGPEPGPMPRDVRVILRSSNYRLVMDRSVFVERRADGSMFVAALQPGTYSLRVISDRYVSEFRRVQILPAQHTVESLRLRNGSLVTFAFELPGTRASDLRLDVSLRSTDGDEILYDHVSLKDADGVKRFEMRVPPGDYTVTASASNGWSGSGSCRVEPGRESACRVVLRPRADRSSACEVR